ncbi:MAG: S1 RNA-binding domain-containing protein [Candidatus Woesearchaeota archaeon]
MSLYPEEGDLVIATVTNIHYHSVFCELPEYNQTGMIHISEIAPGRIRNVHEYVKEGKTVIAKVLSVDTKKGHIDLSLRRVTEAQRKQKAAQRKQQALVENILTQVAKTTKSSEKELLAALTKAYPEQELYDVFVTYVEQEKPLAVSLNKNVLDTLHEAIQERIKPKEVTIKTSMTIKTYHPQGAVRISNALQEAQVPLFYAGAGTYKVTITDKDYKVAENRLKAFQEHIQEALPEAEIAFSRGK